VTAEPDQPFPARNLGDGVSEPSPFDDGLQSTLPPVADEAGTPQRRFNLRGRTLRQHAARGTLINSGFMVGLNFMQLVRGFIVAGFLTRADYGVWGTLAVSLGTLLLLKSIGIGDKYIQQDEDDQELAFQKAWTLELLLTGIAVVVLLAALPLIALMYGEQKLLLPGLVLIFAIPAGLLQMPVYAYYRQMEFLRQRTLQAIEPVTVFVVAIALAWAGAGYWALFVGSFVGAYAGGIVALIYSPYKLRFRYDSGTMRSYWSFSWPILIAAAGGMVIGQTSILAADIKFGLAGAGTLALATQLAAFSQRADQLVSGSLYPAVCAVKDRTDLLFESFVKTNRLALMWAVPFGFGVALFCHDFVHFGIGSKWQPAVVLLQVYGVVVAIGHVAFNWDVYMRARGETRPMAVAATAATVAFLITGIPLLFVAGMPGLAVGVAVQMVVHLMCRAYYLRRVFDGFEFLAHAVRGLLPAVPAVLAILVLRVLETGERTPRLAVAEFALYGAITLGATLWLEAKLIREVFGYVRARPAQAAT
jgi:O-antigen/teichoic acid export membrane protein